MQTASLNKLAWKKLKQNKLSFSSLVFMVFCVVLGIFSVVISPDKTPMANEMHIELATLKPLTKVQFLHIPKVDIPKISVVDKLFFGNLLTEKRIPISSYTISENELVYFPYQSEQEQKYQGDFKIREQTYWFGTDTFGRDLLSRMLYGIRISLAVGFIAVFISLIIGISLGLLAGYFRGRTDDMIMWFVNVVWSIPTLLMVIAITLALG